MSESFLIATWVNPLTFLEIDEPWASQTPKEVTAETVLEFLTTPELSHDIAEMVKRYKEISVESPRLFAVPAEPRILEKLVWPLRQAKASYIVGNYLGTISLCGMVAEMVAVLLFETGNIAINNVPMDDGSQVSLYGSTFEKLGQERRVNVLRCYGLITEEQEKAFDELRQIRRHYLHLWSKSHHSLPQDAVRAFLATMKVVVAVIGHGVAPGGKITLTNAMQAYLAKAGGNVVMPVPGKVEEQRADGAHISRDEATAPPGEEEPSS